MKRDTCKISIVVPVHNNEKTLEKCVRSIVNQPIQQLECILVENNSTDASYDICRKLEKKYDQVRCLCTKKAGVSSARNLGLQYATGDVIGFCDADDRLTKNALQLVEREFLEEVSLEILIGGYDKVSRNERGFRHKILSLSHEMHLSPKRALGYVICDTRVFGSIWNKYYAKAVVKDILFSEELSHCEDMHFNVLALQHCKQIKIIPQVLYYYCENQESASNSQSNIFDANGQLKYFAAFSKIVEDGDDKAIQDYIGFAKTKVAMETMIYLSPTAEEKKQLRQVIHANMRSYLRYMMSYNQKNAIKTLVLYLSKC